MVLNKRGFGVTTETVMYLVLFILFFSLMFWYVTSYQDGAAFWEDFYAKQIADFINSAEPGMEFNLDVTRLSRIALSNGVKLSDLVHIDNVNNEVVVGARVGKGTSYSFFKDNDVIDWETVPVSGSLETNQFVFKIVEKQKGDK